MGALHGWKAKILSALKPATNFFKMKIYYAADLRAHDATEASYTTSRNYPGVTSPR